MRYAVSYQRRCPDSHLRSALVFHRGPKYMFEDDIEADIARGDAAWAKIWGSEPFYNTNCFFNGSHTNTN